MMVQMILENVVGDAYFYSRSLVPCSTERKQRAITSSPVFPESSINTMPKGDELCDDTMNIRVRRNHAYTEVQFATSSSAESPWMRNSAIHRLCIGEYSRGSEGSGLMLYRAPSIQASYMNQ
jgi:hypothetical protein